MPKVFWCMRTKGLLRWCKRGLHWCKTGSYWCKRPLGHRFSKWPKHLLHPLLTTLGNYEASGLCSRHSRSQLQSRKVPVELLFPRVPDCPERRAGATLGKRKRRWKRACVSIGGRWPRTRRIPAKVFERRHQQQLQTGSARLATRS